MGSCFGINHHHNNYKTPVSESIPSQKLNTTLEMQRELFAQNYLVNIKKLMYVPRLRIENSNLYNKRIRRKASEIDILNLIELKEKDEIVNVTNEPLTSGISPSTCTANEINEFQSGLN
ncbi:unnamed protein product [Blepharisma stoltei]|uniref:Uncharacterized protein n=1 Tax=Blepharisma stoltei TaxID=1481888 RepID=A0AAU9JUJ8_9CILI|nr:unnamed protein product [Blepharisma stoltei]